MLNQIWFSPRNSVNGQRWREGLDDVKEPGWWPSMGHVNAADRVFFLASSTLDKWRSACGAWDVVPQSLDTAWKAFAGAIISWANTTIDRIAQQSEDECRARSIELPELPELVALKAAIQEVN